jgi:hypothetical protein
MLGQDRAPLIVVIGRVIEMQHGGAVVDHVDGAGLPPGVWIGEARTRVAADLPGERDVLGGDRHAVAPH